MPASAVVVVPDREMGQIKADYYSKRNYSCNAEKATYESLLLGSQLWDFPSVF